MHVGKRVRDAAAGVARRLLGIRFGREGFNPIPRGSKELLIHPPHVEVSQFEAFDDLFIELGFREKNGHLGSVANRCRIACGLRPSVAKYLAPCVVYHGRGKALIGGELLGQKTDV